ncbi:hypothetical protein IFM89_018166 [Coptis chinensis]|uniref:Large ribosomal subunit protein uL6 alpha-beta domain-containing protein n=1 Tax=Coptis chinensis TaxID=261450 RepID=A0A835I5S8_9MAGN|nr:hypothetical protein IFM89_018166 [Coptis chinensis]
MSSSILGMTSLFLGRSSCTSLASNKNLPNQKSSRNIIIKMSSESPPFKIILGSSSMARRQILSEMGYKFEIMTADIDEKGIRMEKPEELVMALAEAKADAIMSMLQNTNLPDQDDKYTLLITADTKEPTSTSFCCPACHQPDILRDPDHRWHAGNCLLLNFDLEVVVYDGVIREKPSSKEEAREFIKGYSSGHAATVGSVLITNLKTGIRKGGWDKVEIYFHDIPDEVTDKLIEEGVVLNVAGALIIEHPLILPIVKEVVGTTDSVMGLPKALTEKLIQEVLHEVELSVPPAVRVFCFKPNIVCCTGIDKQRVHQFAATVRSCKPPEVYKGKGLHCLRMAFVFVYVTIAVCCSKDPHTYENRSQKYLQLSLKSSCLVVMRYCFLRF